MAKRKYLALLQQGVQSWNLWREQHPNIDPDFVGAHLRGAHLRGANLIRALQLHFFLSSLFL